MLLNGIPPEGINRRRLTRSVFGNIDVFAHIHILTRRRKDFPEVVRSLGCALIDAYPTRWDTRENQLHDAAPYIVLSERQRGRIVTKPRRKAVGQGAFQEDAERFIGSEGFEKRHRDLFRDAFRAYEYRSDPVFHCGVAAQIEGHTIQLFKLGLTLGI